MRRVGTVERRQEVGIRGSTWLGVVPDAFRVAGTAMDIDRQCEIGDALWDEFDGRVLAIKMRRHTNPRKFTAGVIEVVVKFHLDLLAVVAKVNSQVERLRDFDDSDVDVEEPAESEGSTDSDDEPQFFVRPLFASGGGGHKERVRDYCLLHENDCEDYGGEVLLCHMPT